MNQVIAEDPEATISQQKKKTKSSKQKHQQRKKMSTGKKNTKSSNQKRQKRTNVAKQSNSSQQVSSSQPIASKNSRKTVKRTSTQASPQPQSQLQPQLQIVHTLPNVAAQATQAFDSMQRASTMPAVPPSTSLTTSSTSSLMVGGIAPVHGATLLDSTTDSAFQLSQQQLQNIMLQIIEQQQYQQLAGAYQRYQYLCRQMQAIEEQLKQVQELELQQKLQLQHQQLRDQILQCIQLIQGLISQPRQSSQSALLLVGSCPIHIH